MKYRGTRTRFSEPRSLQEAEQQNNRLASLQVSANRVRTDPKALNEITYLTHDAAHQLIQSHLDPEYESPTKLDLRAFLRKHQDQAQVTPEDLAELDCLPCKQKMLELLGKDA